MVVVVVARVGMFVVVVVVEAVVGMVVVVVEAVVGMVVVVVVDARVGMFPSHDTHMFLQ